MPKAPHGSMAEQTVVPSAQCLLLPDGLDDLTAAAIANPGMWAWVAYSERAKLKAGETVLVNSATGTAGRLAVITLEIVEKIIASVNKISRMSGGFVAVFSRLIPQTVTIVSIFVGSSAGQMPQSDLDLSWSNGLLASRPFADAHLEDGDPGANSTENLADAAQRLLSEVRETHYQHNRHIDKVAGAYDMDCSEFVDYLLKRVAPEQFSQIPVEPGHVRPRAAMYFQFLKRLRQQPLIGWQAVYQLGDAQRGDIIAWELHASTQEPGDTGHVVIVASKPVLKTRDLYAVKVYDSSGVVHDNDSRPEHTSGVGSGVITFRINQSGEPIAFQFNSRANFHTEPIAIGRLVSSE
jgi:hypothetical protein